ncbi:MAG: HupE/UreJ family protein [Vicinamibacterales bacterium]
MNTRKMAPLAGFLLVAIIGLLTLPLRAHEIPTSTRIQMFLRAEGNVLRVLVRAPLSAMQDSTVWPLNGVYLVLGESHQTLLDAAQVYVADNIDIFEGDRQLPYPRIVAAHAALPSSRAFDSYEAALASLMGTPLPDDSEFVFEQGMNDILLEYPIESADSRFSIYPDFFMLGLQVTTVLRYITPDGAERAFEIHGDPGMVRLDPRWHQAALRFVSSGFDHILDGIDHLLFLLCLVIPFRRLKSLLPIVTAFTIAHSITLIASAYGIAPDSLWFPPLVETLIAASIVYMALENIVSPGLKRRWLIAFSFGLIHGFGFSFALRETLQFAGAHLVTSLLSFNIGVEIGQIFVLCFFVPALFLLFKYVVDERVGTIILSALVAHTGWHWMTERGSQLMLYQFSWPVFDAIFFAGFVRGLMVLVVAAAAAWLISLVIGDSAKEAKA